jgi:protein involved in polysaccharide export with SLBB domain
LYTYIKSHTFVPIIQSEKKGLGKTNMSRKLWRDTMSQAIRDKHPIIVLCIIFFIVASAIANAQNIGQIKKPFSPRFASERGKFYGEEEIELQKPAFPALTTPTQQIQPYVPEKSVIEELFRGQIPPADVPLTQFGYSFFKPLEELPLYSLPVTADYAFGPGDQLVLYVWGDVFRIFATDFEPVFTLSVDRDGKIFVPQIGVFHVWGATVKEVEEIVQRAIDAKVKGAHVKVTVGNLRVFPVYLVGEVIQPGSVLVNGLSTVIDALSLAGGVKKTGSLRGISLKRRQKGKIQEVKIDLYDLFIEGTPQLISLREGDVITVYPIGTVVGVSGNVRRPAIYELKEEKTAAQVLNFGGGVLPSGNLQRIQVERFHENQKKVVLDVPLGEDVLRRFELFDGDLLKVYPIYEEPENIVYLEGNVKNAGVYQYRRGMRLSELIRSPDDLLPETYLRYAEIIRRKGLGKEPVTIPFSMEGFLKHQINPELEPLDRIKIFSRLAYPQIEIGGEVEKPGSYPYWEGIRLRDILGTAVIKDDPQHLKVEIFPEEKLEIPEEPEEEVAVAPPSRALPMEREALEPGEEEREALEPGEEEKIALEFPGVRVVYLYDLMVLGKEEINLSLEPGMRLIVKPIETGERVKSVTILGRVKNPGVYPIHDGDRLSNLLVRAGGFTEDAYPRGVVFLRESVRRMQEERLKTTMLAIEEGLIRQTAEAESRLTPEEIQAIRLSIQRQKQLLENIEAKTKLVLGRVSITVPSEIAKLRSTTDDLLLEDGDEVYVPKLPESTIILGEVYNPVALAYRSDKSIRYYLDRAGGLTEFSNTKEMFVIKPDGTVMSRRQKGFMWMKSWDEGSKRIYFVKRFEDIALDPGDTIVIPSKVEIPILWRPLIRDIVQIIFQAISTVAIIDRL